MQITAVLQGVTFTPATVEKSAQRLSALLHIDELGRILVEFQIRYFVYLVIRNRESEAVAKCLQRNCAHLFLLMGNILGFSRFAHPIALDRLGKNNSRLSGMFYGCRICRIDFMRIMPSTIQPPDIVVGHVGDHFQQFWIFTEEMFPPIGTVLCCEGLVFTIHAFHHALLQQAFNVCG